MALTQALPRFPSSPDPPFWRFPWRYNSEKNQVLQQNHACEYEGDSETLVKKELLRVTSSFDVALRKKVTHSNHLCGVFHGGKAELNKNSQNKMLILTFRRMAAHSIHLGRVFHGGMSEWEQTPYKTSRVTVIALSLRGLQNLQMNSLDGLIVWHTPSSSLQRVSLRHFC